MSTKTKPRRINLFAISKSTPALKSFENRKARRQAGGWGSMFKDASVYQHFMRYAQVAVIRTCGPGQVFPDQTQCGPRLLADIPRF